MYAYNPSTSHLTQGCGIGCRLPGQGERLVDGVDDGAELCLVLEDTRRQLDRDGRVFGSRLPEGDVALLVRRELLLSGC